MNIHLSLSAFVRQSIFLLFLMIASQSLYAQDSTEFVVYDVIHLKDGRILKGEITSFDEKDGGIVFKDLNGRIYSFGRVDYEYFEENQLFPVKQKKDRVVHPRKENEFAFTAGLSGTFLNFSHDFTPDDYYIGASSYIGLLPFCVRVGAGRFFGRQHYLGANVDFALSSGNDRYFNAGVRYAFHYDGAKSNIGLYIPVEAKFSSTRFTIQYLADDTTFFDNTGNNYSYPSSLEPNITLNAFDLFIGHGFALNFANKKSLAAEIGYVKSSVMSMKHDLATGDPRSAFYGGGLKFGLFMNF